MAHRRPCRWSIATLVAVASLWACAAQPTVELALGVLGSFQEDLHKLLGIIVADLDFRKHSEAALVARFGPPIMDISNRSFYPGLRVRPVIVDDQGKDAVGANATVNFALGMNGYPKVSGLMGPTSSNIALASAPNSAANSLNQVAIDGATSEALSDKERFPFFFRTNMPGSNQGRILWQYVAYFGFHGVTVLSVLHESSQAVQQGILLGALLTHRSEAVKATAVPSTTTAEATDLAEWAGAVAFAKAAHNRLVIILGPEEMAGTFMRYVPNHGICAPQYQLLMTPSIDGSTDWPMSMDRAHKIYPMFTANSRFNNYTRMYLQVNATDILSGMERYGLDRWFNKSRVPEVLTKSLDLMGLATAAVWFNVFNIFVSAFGELLNEGTAPQDVGGELLKAKLAKSEIACIVSNIRFDARQDGVTTWSIASAQVYDPPIAFGGVPVKVKLNQLALCQINKAADGTNVFSIEPFAAQRWASGAVSLSAPANLTTCLLGQYLSLVDDAPPGRCIDCPEGTVANTSDQTECLKCPAGTRGDELRTTCVACPPGQYNPDKGSKECSLCMAGSVAAVNGSQGCELCPLGTYADTPHAGATACVPCAEGLTTLKDEGSTRQTLVTAVLVAGQMVACVQALSVIQQVKITWVQPLLTVWQLTGFVSLDMDLLKVACVLRQDRPVSNFVMQLVDLPVLAVLLGILMLAISRIRARLWKTGRRVSWDRYLNMLGQLVVMVYISITVAMLRPLICKQHPNGLRSVASRMAVVCWQSAEHRTLVALSAIGVLCYPVSLLATVAWATAMYPCKAVLLPWRTPLANLSEILTLVCVLLFLQAAGFLVGAASGGSPELVSYLLLAIIIAMLLTTVAVFGYSLARFFMPGTQYAIFLCHHKEGAGSLGRWLKIQVACVSRAAVFLDSDQLEELDLIVDTVRCRTKTLLILLTRLTLSRIWCAAETASAVANNVPIVPLACCDYEPYTQEQVDNLGETWSELQKHSVAQYGIQLEHIRKAYEHLAGLTTVEFRRFAPLEEQRVAAFRAFHLCGVCGPSPPARSAAPAPACIVVAGASGDAEARTTCEVLQHMVQVKTQVPVVAVHNWQEARPHAAGASYLLVVLTRGLIQDAAFMEVGLEFDAADRLSPVEIVTALADTNFAFPAAETFEALENQGGDEERLAKFLRRVFNILALPVSPHGSAGIMDAQVGELCRRFKGDTMRPSAARTDASMQSSEDAGPRGAPWRQPADLAQPKPIAPPRTLRPATAEAQQAQEEKVELPPDITDVGEDSDVVTANV